MGNGYFQSLACGFLFLIYASHAAPSTAASQVNCWDTQNVTKDVSFSSSTTGVNMNAVLLADPKTELGGDQHRFKLTENVIVRLSGNGDIYLVQNDKHYEFPEGNVALVTGTQIIFDGPRAPKKGDKISIPLAQGLNPSLPATVDTLNLVPTSEFGSDTLQSGWLPSAGALPTLKLRADKPGAFSDVRDTSKIRACLLIGKEWRQVNVTAFEKDATASSALLTVALPQDQFGNYPDSYRIAVSINNGAFIASRDFIFVPRWVGFLVAMIIFAIGHFAVWRLTINRCSPIRHAFTHGSLGRFSAAWFAGPGGIPSLSMFQIYVWTWVVVWGLTYVVVQTLELFALSSQVLWVLGIAGVGSLTARFISASSVETQPTTEPRFSDILRTDGSLDLYKLQMFIFTCFTAAWVVARIIVDQAFPPLDENLLLLMGISNGLYVGSKVVAETPQEAVARLTREMEKAISDRNSLQVRVDQLTEAAKISGANQEAAKRDLTSATPLLAAANKKVDAVADELTKARAKMAPQQ